MPKEVSKMKNRIKWVKENWEFKYTETTAPSSVEEYKKERDILWDTYFGFDGTCLSHDKLGCPECRIPATGRCYSSLEE
jgi:hypothetical protein